MLKTLTFAVAIAALLFAGCSGRGDDDGGGDNSDDSGSSGEKRNPGGAPTPTSDELEALSALTVPGFTATDGGLGLIGSGVTYTSQQTTASGAQIVVLVRLAACDAFICNKLDPAKYTGDEEQRNLKSILPLIHIENPALRWEFGEAEFSKDATGLATYAVSYVESKEPGGAVSRASVNEYFAWWHNDGIFVNLNIYPRGGDTSFSQEDVNKRMTKDEARKALKDVFAVLEPKLPKK